jgi:hypothetical protein
MFRKVTIALLATAAFGMLTPDVASARGGGHGGFGGFHGFYGGRFHGGGGFGRDGFRAGGFGRGFRDAAIGGRTFRAGGQGIKREVMHCITPDCSITHTFRD